MTRMARRGWSAGTTSSRVVRQMKPDCSCSYPRIWSSFRPPGGTYQRRRRNPEPEATALREVEAAAYFSSLLKANLVVDALGMAVTRRRPRGSVVHHSDRGSQYASLAFGATLRDSDIMASMGSRGDAYDNAAAESFMVALWSATAPETVVMTPTAVPPWPSRLLVWRATEMACTALGSILAFAMLFLAVSPGCLSLRLRRASTSPRPCCGRGCWPLC